MSTISAQTLRETDFGPLAQASGEWRWLWRRLEEDAAHLHDEIGDRIDAESFVGQSADLARANLDDLVRDTETAAVAAKTVHGLLEDAVTDLWDCQHQLDGVMTEAIHQGFATTESGVLHFGELAVTDERQSMLASFSNEIVAIVDRARGIDDDITARLSELLDDGGRAFGPPTIGADMAAIIGDLPGPDASPESVNDFWNSLSKDEQDFLIEQHPDWVGGADGVPSATRDEANRLRLQDEKETIQAELAAIEAELAEMNSTGTASVDAADVLRDRQVELQNRLDNINALNNAISGTAPTGDEYLLIDYDSAADGKAIIAIGDPDHADNTALYVPGTGSDVAGISGLMGRAEGMAREANLKDPSDETSVILWLDYDAPDGLTDATSKDYANNAAAGFSNFTNGLEATHRSGVGGGNTTLIGHSYGTTTIGAAADQHGVATDNIIALGSPGMMVDQAADLGIDPDNVYASTASGDPISLANEQSSSAATGSAIGLITGPGGAMLGGFVGGMLGDDDQMIHGTDPTSSDFGGQTFKSTDAVPDWQVWNAIDEHSNYWTEGGAALDNMGYIVTGQPEEVY